MRIQYEIGDWVTAPGIDGAKRVVDKGRWHLELEVDGQRKRVDKRNCRPNSFTMNSAKVS